MDVVIPLSARRCAAALGVVALVLVAASVVASLLSQVSVQDPFLREVTQSLVRLAWVDGEGNIPAWYSASLFLLGSLLLAAIASGRRQQRGEHVAHWTVLSLIFAFLSLDETASLHELSIAPLRDSFGATGLLYYGWIVPAAVCVVLFVLAYLAFLARLPPRTRRLFVVAGAIFVGGAIGVEAISGQHASVHGEGDLTYHFIITIEELLEMSGVILFIYALLDYIARQFPRLGFLITSR